MLSGDTLYGAAIGGGPYGVGTLFKLNVNGTGFTCLKRFSGSDGACPCGDLVLRGDTLYGTTYYGGGANNGTVFKINTNGTGFGVLKSFAAESYGTNSDGAWPSGGLGLSGDTLYGTADEGGSQGFGLVFSLTLPPPLHILTSDRVFGVQSNGFCFSVAGPSNQTVVVEACLDLHATNWVSLLTNTLGNAPLQFCDPDWNHYPGRFYRVHGQ